MARGPYFTSPLLLGFEEFERVLDRVSKTSHEGYPPYNIEQLGERRIRITLAVAGFDREALHVTIEENQLVIRGRQDEESDKTFIHRGIATRQFQRAFVLAEGIEVVGANLENGLLAIDLLRPPARTQVRSIEITAGRPPTGEVREPFSVIARRKES